MKKNKAIFGVQYSFLLILFTILAAIMLFPILWTMVSSFKRDIEIIKYPPTLFPETFTLDGFITCVKRIDIFIYLRNSFIYSFGATIPSLFVNTMAGYAFARYKFKGKDPLFIAFLATMMVPFQVIMIPSFLMVHSLGMYDNYAGLIIPKIAAAYWIFLMRSAFAQLPKELEEAARIDGLNEFGIYFRIMLPQIKPALVTLVILSVNGL